MLVEGKKIAGEMEHRLRKRVEEGKMGLTLGIIVVHETAPIRQFVEVKRRFGDAINVHVEVLQLGPMSHKNEDLLALLLHSTRNHDGIVLQLPLPHQYSLDSVLNLFPLSHDVDVIGNTAYRQFEEATLPFYPPVVGALHEVLRHHGLGLAGRKVLVVGEGRLVGGPAAIWARRVGAYVTVANIETPNLAELSRDAEVLILGAGVPGLIKPDMVQQNAIVLDAGTSEVSGVIKGDADPAVAEKAGLFTPTPRGLGPITVAKVFENLITLYEIKQKRLG
jgi:methylenetetrahydrofolate dehydrogenase (NADP+)/methenyltetrahydrofolate cyclohydrolase